MARNTQRFRRIGNYTMDDLLKDLRDFEAEMLGVKDGVDSGSLQGPPGPPGVKGEPGARSTVPGPVGPQGKRGLAGDDGLSAYEIAVNVTGFDGTEEDWIASLQATAVNTKNEDWGLIPSDWGHITSTVITSSYDYGSVTEEAA